MLLFTIDAAKPVSFSNFGRFVQERRWEHNGRSMDVNLAVIVLSGEAEFRFGGQVYPVRRGSCVVIPGGNFYTAHTDGRCEYYYLHFSGVTGDAPEGTLPRGADLEAVAQAASLPVPLPPVQQLGDRFEDALDLLCQCDLLRAASDTRSALLLQAQLTRLLIEIAALPDVAAGRMPPLLERILRFIDEHYAEPVSLSRLSREFFVSGEYIARLFRRYLGTSSSKYVNTVKIRYAKIMLTEQNVTVAQIAERLGFCDAFYFSKVFKQIEGVPPQAFLRDAR